MLSNNKASSGAGAYLYTSNSNPLFLSSSMIENQASLEGGGLYSLNSNVGVTLFAMLLAGNIAGTNGGGINIATAHAGWLIQKTAFTDNKAITGNGGGLYLNTNNGIGLLASGNQITLQSCDFHTNFAANNGGGVYLSNGNIIAVISNLFYSNNATAGYGGAIAANVANNVTVTKNTFQLNLAGNYGGGMGLNGLNQPISLAGNTFAANVARKQGGGFSINGGSIVTFTQTNTFTGNQAPAGGAMSLSSSPLWSMSATTAGVANLMITGNKASVGSGMLISKLSYSSNALQNITFTNNRATSGGTLYWLYDIELMPSPPPGVNSSSLVWSNNSALYGVKQATQAVQLVGPTKYTVTNYGQPLVPALVFKLVDYYGHLVLSNSSTTVFPQIDTSIPPKCGGLYPYLSGANTVGSGVVASAGMAIFNQLEAFCNPNGTVGVQFVAQLGSLVGVSSTTASPYYVYQTTMFEFRNCTAGEYIKDGNCLPCPTGSFSLFPNSDYCESCVDVTGITTCYRDQIIVESGYWRRYPTVSTVLECVYDNSCQGGNQTGDASCFTGYEGPLCAVCADGYFLQENTCEPCSSADSSTTTVVYLTLFCFLVVVAALIYYFRDNIFKTEDQINQEDAERRIRDSQVLRPSDNSQIVDEVGMVEIHEEVESSDASSIMTEIQLFILWLRKTFNDIITQLKIIVSTYQVVLATAVTVQVKLPFSFESFTDALSFFNLNISSIIPVTCTTYEASFIDVLVLVTLAPIAASILIFIAFALHYRIRVRMLEIQKAKANSGNTSNVSAVKTEDEDAKRLDIYEELKDRYLNYFFYLTYLVLPSVTTTIVAMFPCTDIDPDHQDSDQADYYLTADMSISCSSTEYKSGVLYAVLMIIVYPIGVPLMYAVLLYRNREEISSRDDNSNIKEDDPDQQVMAATNPMLQSHLALSSKSRHDSHTDSVKGSSVAQKPSDVSQKDSKLSLASAATSSHDTTKEKVKEDHKGKDHQAEGDEEVSAELSPAAARLAFLWEAYRPEYWYWELVETYRKLTLTAVLSVCNPGSPEQNVFSIVLTMLFIKLYSYYSPYSEDAINTLSEIGQYQIFFTFFCDMIINNELLGRELWPLVGVLLIIVNMTVVLVTAYFDLLQYYEQEEELSPAGSQAAPSRLKRFIYYIKSFNDNINEIHAKKAKKSYATAKANEHYIEAVRIRNQRKLQERESIMKRQSIKNKAPTIKRNAEEFDYDIELENRSHRESFSAPKN